MSTFLLKVTNIRSEEITDLMADGEAMAELEAELTACYHAIQND